MARNLLRPTWAVIWRFLLVLTIWGTLMAPFFVLVMARLSERGLTDIPVTWLFQESVLAIAAFCSVLGVTRVVDRQPIASLGLTPARAVPQFIRGSAIGAGIIIAAVALLMVLGIARRLPVPRAQATTLAIAAVATLVNAFTQEILFQGYLLPSILRRSTPYVALAASGIVFVLIHGPAAVLDPIPGLNLFLAALLLGSARLRSNALWLPLGIHFGWNLVEGPLLGLIVSGHELAGWKLLELAGPRYLSGGTYGPEGSLVATVMTLVGLGIVCRTHDRLDLSEARDGVR